MIGLATTAVDLLLGFHFHCFASCPKAKEAEVRRLRREADSDRQGLDGARQACLDREREVSSMEERLRERYVEADEVEVRCLYIPTVEETFSLDTAGPR